MAWPEELKAFYDGFADQHRKLVETLRPLTPEQMQLRAAPSEWAIWQLASNMVGGRMYWLCFMLGEDDQGVGPDWTGWEDTPEHPRTSAELVEAFEKKDYILIGDLCEYEIAPKIISLIETVEQALSA